MVRKNTLKTKILSALVSSFVISLSVLSGNVSAEVPCAAGTTCTNFEVNIPEILTVQITRPNSWAVGDVGVFLRNMITLNIVSNNPAGFTASMTTGATTAAGSALTNTYADSTSTIPMLTSNWTRSDTTVTKFWGYSLDDASETGTYGTLALKGATTPVTIIPAGTMETASKDIYIGAKADSSIDSGTYQGTIIISVVSGTITEDNPVTPTDPATPDDTIADNPAYQPGASASDPGRTIYTNTNYSGTTNTSTLEVSEGDTRTSYQDPQGVSTARINEGTPLATGLAVTAAVAAVAGIAFFVIARKRDEDDGDEF